MKGGREGGRRRQRFYRGDATAVGHDARAPAAVGRGARIPAAVSHGGRNLTHLAVQPTVGATPNAVPHGGRNSRRGV
jgi:hypothetical protein